MARRGRRLTIGGSGTEDNAVGGPRGEVKSYLPPSEADQATQAAAIAAASIPSPEATPVTIIVPGEPPSAGGGDAPSGGNEGEGGPGGEGGDTSSGEGTGDFKRGGLVGKGGGSVEANEFVMPTGVVKKYGHAVLEALRSGKAKIQKQSAKHGARLAH